MLLDFLRGLGILGESRNKPAYLFAVNSGYSSLVAQSICRKTYQRSNFPSRTADEMIIEL